jgi:glycosyltransferase involved in cell wall biosynthesis
MTPAAGASAPAQVTLDGSPPLLRERITGPRRPRVSVVIPTLNEAENLPHVFAELPPWLHEVIVVDGFSSDGTPEVARRLLPSALIVGQQRPGKGDALRCGFAAAGGDILVMLDADGSAAPAEIPAFVAALLDGADFAKGTRNRAGGGSSDITRLRRTGNRALSATVNLLYGTAYSDLCYGYNAFWRHCLPAIAIDCAGFEVETLINIRVARAGLKVVEVPSFERERIHGHSNLNTFRDGGRVLRTILRERVRRAPQRADEHVLCGEGIAAELA